MPTPEWIKSLRRKEAILDRMAALLRGNDELSNAVKDALSQSTDFKDDDLREWLNNVTQKILF